MKPAREMIKAGNSYRMQVHVDAKGNLTATVNGMRLLDRPLVERAGWRVRSHAALDAAPSA